MRFLENKFHHLLYFKCFKYLIVTQKNSIWNCYLNVEYYPEKNKIGVLFCIKFLFPKQKLQDYLCKVEKSIINIKLKFFTNKKINFLLFNVILWDTKTTINVAVEIFDSKIFRILIMFYDKNYDFRKIESLLSLICHIFAKIMQ